MQRTAEPGYEAADIAEDIQGAIWDRMEAFKGDTSSKYTGVIGKAYADGKDAGPTALIEVTDAYGKRWDVVVSEAGA